MLIIYVYYRYNSIKHVKLIERADVFSFQCYYNFFITLKFRGL